MSHQVGSPQTHTCTSESVSNIFCPRFHVHLHFLFCTNLKCKFCRSEGTGVRGQEGLCREFWGKGGLYCDPSLGQMGTGTNRDRPWDKPALRNYGKIDILSHLSLGRVGFVAGTIVPQGAFYEMFMFREAPDTFNFLRHVMRAISSVRPKCSHRCVSPKETPLKPVQILSHTTKNSAEQTAMRTKWFKHIAI